MDCVSANDAIVLSAIMLVDGRQHMIVTPNPEMVLAAQSDGDLRQILNKADLALPDGTGILWAAKKLGVDLKERVTGTDFIYDLAGLASRRGEKMALIGGEHGVAQKAASELQKKFLNLEVRGFDCGKISDQISHEVLSAVEEWRPEVLVVGLGAGKQEKLISKILPQLPGVKIAIGVGGALDYISGRALRAPKRWQDSGVEWFWRVLHEPMRLPRILNATVKFPYVFLKTQGPR